MEVVPSQDDIVEEIIDDYSERFDNTVKPDQKKDSSIVDDY